MVALASSSYNVRTTQQNNSIAQKELTYEERQRQKDMDYAWNLDYKLASEANLGYNEGLLLLSLGNASTLPRYVPNLFRRLDTMTTLYPHDQNGNPLTRTCTGPCGRVLPATAEYFQRKKSGKDELRARCKKCQAKTRATRLANLREKREQDIPLEKICKGPCGRTLPATTEYFQRKGRSLRTQCKKCLQEEYQIKRLLEPKKEFPDKKQCIGPCQRVLPVTSEYFQRNKKTRDGFLPRCKECCSDQHKNNPNRERRLADQRAYNNRPEVRERRQESERARRTNPETREDFLSMKRAIYNSSASKARLKEYYKRPEVRERKREANKKRYHDPVVGARIREQHRIKTLNYIARKKGISGKHTPAQIQEQLKRQHYRCYYAACGHAKFKKVNGKYVYHVDHTYPISRIVNSDIPANGIDYLVLACPSCNSSKRDKFPWEWPEGGRLL